jgi:hypothetical protein
LRVRQYVFGRLELFTVQRLLVLHPPADIALSPLLPDKPQQTAALLDYLGNVSA